MRFDEKISVVMPTYNTPLPILKEAVDSILNQTFSFFEFIIIDDCSSDDSWDYLKSLRDPRIRLYRNETSLGVTKSLNVGLRIANGKYIARMDADDISLPERFEKQYAFMENHPDAIMCGTRHGFFGLRNGTSNSVISDMDTYRVQLIFSNPGPAHSSVFLNHEKLIRNYIFYDENLIYSQDYGMWYTVSKYGNVYQLKCVLLLRRIHEKQITQMYRKKQIECDKITQRKILCELLGDITDEELDLHYRHSTQYFPDATISETVNQWYDKILKANSKSHIYNQKVLEQYIFKIRSRLIHQSFTPDMKAIKKAILYFKYLPISEAIKKMQFVIENKFMKISEPKATLHDL